MLNKITHLKLYKKDRLDIIITKYRLKSTLKITKLSY